jgi:hypothetical protein
MFAKRPLPEREGPLFHVDNTRLEALTLMIDSKMGREISSHGPCQKEMKFIGSGG